MARDRDMDEQLNRYDEAWDRHEELMAHQARELNELRTMMVRFNSKGNQIRADTKETWRRIDRFLNGGEQTA